MAVLITYDLGQHGWSSFVLKVGDVSTKVGEFGYCTDALGDLVRAALEIAAGAYRSVVSFDAEPTEWRLVLQRDWTSPEASTLIIQVLTFPDLAAEAPLEKGELHFEARCDADEFARAVSDAAAAIWEAYGPEGYNKVWSGPVGFPRRALTALEAALSMPDAPPPDRAAGEAVGGFVILGTRSDD